MAFSTISKMSATLFLLINIVSLMTYSTISQMSAWIHSFSFQLTHPQFHWILYYKPNICLTLLPFSWHIDNLMAFSTISQMSAWPYFNSVDIQKISCHSLKLANYLLETTSSQLSQIDNLMAFSTISKMSASPHFFSAVTHRQFNGIICY